MVEGNHETWNQQCACILFQGLDIGTCMVVVGGCRHIDGDEGWGREHKLGLSVDSHMEVCGIYMHICIEVEVGSLHGHDYGGINYRLVLSSGDQWQRSGSRDQLQVQA